ncbi:hypothetical protein CRE_14377 [Caenorhabditis remanei]|uniref:Ribosomal RNA-processing protein 8 n=1 Tax=Caenorhabditis remanei TaxID=31234 RepID=E3NM66_CAERE|nr:hypothetical protein CRE_14377 [Caenorhabditis remanei]
MAKKRKIDDEKRAEGAPAEKKEKVEKWLKTSGDSEGATTTEKKKKRPWRNKVRKLAAKKAAAEKKTSENPEESMILEASDDVTKKKKKRGPKKKKFKPEVVEKKADDVTEDSEVVDKIADAKKRLDAGRFRYLNEKLYTCTGSEAFDFFKEVRTAFDLYHKGFADQVLKI